MLIKTLMKSDINSFSTENPIELTSSLPDVISQLENNFGLLPNPDKLKVWNFMHKLISADASVIEQISDIDLPLIKYIVIHIIGSEFEYIPNKQQAWDDLCKIIIDEYDSELLLGAVIALSNAFKHIPDKTQAWNEFYKLSDINNSRVTLFLTGMYSSVVEYVPNKYEFWKDMYQLTVSENPAIKHGISESLGETFAYLSEKFKIRAWDELHCLSISDNCSNKFIAANSIHLAYPHIPEELKTQAFYDLSRLADDDDFEIRSFTVIFIGNVYPHIPEELKTQAFDDLSRLVDDDDFEIKSYAVYSIGNIYLHLNDELKTQALYILSKLTGDDDPDVKIYSNYYLGKIEIYEAVKTENNDDFRARIENAIEYFEKAANTGAQSFSLNPAKFCYPFYCCFNLVVIKKEYSKDEINFHLEAAKKEIFNFEHKKKLIEALDRFSDALKFAHDVHKMDIDSRNVLLEYCLNICSEAEKLIDETKEKAPNIQEVFAIAKPTFEEYITELIADVEEKAKVAHEEAKGTPAEEIAQFVKEDIQRWDVNNQEQMETNLENLTFSLKSQVPNISGNENIISKIDEIKNCTKVEDQIAILTMLIPLIPTMTIPNRLDDIDEKMSYLISSINEIKISMKPSIKEEIQVTIGISGFGSGIQRVITIPIQEISYSEIQDDLQKCSDKMMDIAKFPAKLKDKIMEYLRNNEDKFESSRS